MKRRNNSTFVLSLDSVIMSRYSMTPEHFFELFLIELEGKPEMYHYYKFLKGEKSFGFRKNYFLERLRYIYHYIVLNNKNTDTIKIWDCGSGYGTTCLFLAMNGIQAHGTTLEFYQEIAEKRIEYWQQYGPAEKFTSSYENLFDNQPEKNSYDIIIVQDTLHHLEPIDEALDIFHHSLKSNGFLISIEENGSNIIQSLKLYKQRGNKRIIKFWDEKLQKEILIGNENIRSLDIWNVLFEKHGFVIPKEKVNYVRYYLPFMYKEGNSDYLLEKERRIQSKSSFRKKYFFFGINFIAYKK